MSRTSTARAPSRRERPDLSRWFGDPASRRPTVSPERVSRLRTSPDSAKPLSVYVAQFSVHCMLHGGVFSGLQVEQWLRCNDQRWPSDKSAEAQHGYRKRFLHPVFTPRFSNRPMAATLRFQQGATFAHFSSKPAYQAIGLPDSRFRRTGAMPLVMQRLLAYDFVVERPDLGWIGEQAHKLEFFDALGVDRAVLPQRRYKAGDAPGVSAAARGRASGQVPEDRLVWFPDNVPIGYGPWRSIFVFPCQPQTSTSVESRVREYKRLWSALRQRGIRVSVVFVVRGQGSVPGLSTLLKDLPAPADSDDRERVISQVERHVLEHAPQSLGARMDALYRTVGLSTGARVRQLDKFLAAPAAPSAPAGRAKEGVMDVMCFVAERLSAERWNLHALESAQVCY